MSEILAGGLFLGGTLFVVSCFWAVTVAGIVILTSQKWELKTVALGSAGMFPVMSAFTALTAFLNSATTSFSEKELISVPMFGLGASIALLLAWPAAYGLTKRVFRLEKDKHQ